MSGPATPNPRPRVGFLGPEGTFTEQALLSQPDLAAGELVAIPTIPDVLLAVERGEVDYGFVGIENSIEGSVTATVDTLAFETSLVIQREVVMGVQMNLLAPSGVGLADVRRVLSIPIAAAQCRGFFQRELPGVGTVAVGSTAEGARLVAGDENDGALGRHRPGRGRQALRPRGARQRHRGPRRQRHPLRRRRPGGNPHADGARQDDDRGVPAHRPPGLAPHDPAGVRRPVDQPDQARVAPDQEGAGRLLLRHGPRGPHRRGARRRLPARPQVEGGRREVPRLVPGGRRARPRPPAPRPTPPGATPAAGSTA